MKYRKTALIEAEQFDANANAAGLSPEFRAAVCVKGDFSGFHDAAGNLVRYEDNHAPHIHTLEGPHAIRNGDWIARGIKGEFWPIKDDVFRATYESVPEGRQVR